MLFPQESTQEIDYMITEQIGKSHGCCRGLVIRASNAKAADSPIIVNLGHLLGIRV